MVPWPGRIIRGANRAATSHAMPRLAGRLSGCGAHQRRAVASGSGEPRVSGHLVMREGDYDRARRLTEGIVELGRRQRRQMAIELVSYSDLAFVRFWRETYARPKPSAPKGSCSCQELPTADGTAYFLGTLAGSRAAQGRAIRSVRLWGAMEGCWTALARDWTSNTHEETRSVNRL